MSREFGAVQQDTARASKPPDRPALRVGEAVEGTLPCIIQVLAARQRQPEARHRVDILRVNGSLQSLPAATSHSIIQGLYGRQARTLLQTQRSQYRPVAFGVRSH